VNAPELTKFGEIRAVTLRQGRKVHFFGKFT